MRIVCQKCSAAYAIDDKFVTPKGVRAQCPRCRHLQLVKKDDAAAAAPAAAAGPAIPPNPFDKSPSDLFDLSAGPQASTSPGMPAQSGQPGGDARELMDFSELGMSAAPPQADPFGAPEPAPPAPNPFGAPSDSPFGGEADFAAPPSPFGSGFGGGNSPFGASPGAFSPPQLSAQPQPAPALGGGPMPYSPGQPAKQDNPFGSFGNDLFGTAGSQEGAAPLASRASAPPAPAAAPESAGAAAIPDARCKSCGKQIFDPFDQALELCDDCRNKPQVAPGISTAPTATASSLVARPPPPQAKPTGVLAPPEPYKMKVAGAEPTSRTPMFVALAVLVLGVGGYFGYKKFGPKKVPTLVQKVEGPARAIDDMVKGWSLKYPEITGTADEYVQQGDEQMARDTTQGYARAEEAYQKALVLDSKKDRAVAGWALALAFGHFGQIDEPTAAAAQGMLLASERRTSDARVVIAHAHLLLALGSQFTDIKRLADDGVKSVSDKDKALAHLALGQAYLGRNQQFAADNFEKAANLDPKLKRAVLYQAQLLVQNGEIKKAMDSLEKKLTADPDQWETADMLARLYLEGSEPAKARKTYLVVPEVAKDARAQITLAMLAYQHEDQPQAAVKQLEALLKDEESIDPADVISALGHLAAAKRVGGDLDGAASAASRALDKKPSDLNALVQRFLVSVERNKAADARGQLQPLIGRLNNPALELVFQGLVELLDGRPPEAQRLFTKAWETDKRRGDALLLAAASAARAHVEGKAWELALKEGLKLDPWRAAPLPVMAPIYVRPVDTLRAARGAFEPLSREAEDPNPPLAEGLVAWFSDDLDGAAKWFDKVVHFDPDNGAGYAYRSFVALKKGQGAAAEKLALKGLKGDRNQPLAHLALGMSFLAENKIEPAKKSVARASELAPWLLLPRAKLGEINGRQKRPDEARKLLTTVLLNDPLYREARRAQILGGS
jgi:cellulose synthase operon protein C